MKEKFDAMPGYDCGISSFILAYPIHDREKGVIGYVPFRRDLLWVMTFTRVEIDVFPNVTIGELMLDLNLRVWQQRIMEAFFV
jgi:hypothetical protein